ncbi:MAG TPA: FKBP-type peptidyl-prolyl cis-trans isomerase [candidate division Zixibacteria bacterium]
MKSHRMVWLAGAMLMLWGCGQSETPPPQQQSQQPAQQPPQGEALADSAADGIPQLTGDTVTTPSGLKYIEMTEGTGGMPQAGQMVVVHYTGWLTDGTMFDSSRKKGQPYSFPLGQGRVIKGWDEGIALMKVGERRLLIIPYDLAYGEAGRLPRIPQRATLVFDVELLEVRTSG